MHTITLQMPFEYISERIAPLNWQDVRYGIDNRLISPSVAIEFAKYRVVNQSDINDIEVELSFRERDESVMDMVERLAREEDQEDPEVIRGKWLFPVLSWIYDHKNDIDDPLEVAEQIYSDFDYPESLASFIRYMPMKGPDLGSKTANEGRLFEYWQQYLEEEGRKCKDKGNTGVRHR